MHRSPQHSALPAGPAASWLDRAWRLAFRIGFPLARRWWRVRRKPHQGALVAIHVGRALLLVRTSYRQEWTLPGGGVERGEAPVDAARRELAEELGLHAPQLEPAGETSGVWDGRPDRVHFFALRLDRPPALRLDNRETVAARLFLPEELAGMRLTGAVAAYLRARR